MPTYETHAPADPYARSLTASEALTATLSGSTASAWTHAELEDHLDQRARLEEMQLRAGAGAVVVGPEGRARPWREAGHGSWLATVFGLARVTRVAHRGPGLGNVHPADAALSLPAGRHSAGLRRLAVGKAVAARSTRPTTQESAAAGTYSGNASWRNL